MGTVHIAGWEVRTKATPCLRCVHDESETVIRGMLPESCTRCTRDLETPPRRQRDVVTCNEGWGSNLNASLCNPPGSGESRTLGWPCLSVRLLPAVGYPLCGPSSHFSRSSYWWAAGGEAYRIFFS